MPKIIQKGKEPDVIYQGQCTLCGTVAQFTPKEVVCKRRAPSGCLHANAGCPTCGASIRLRNVASTKITVVAAGVDLDHQIDHCDRCKHVFDDPKGEAYPTCDHDGPLTLCQACYRALGTSVR